MKKESYESRSTAHPSFLITTGADPEYEYVFHFDANEWHREDEMQMAANMLVKTFDLAALGHKNGLYTLGEFAHELRTLLDVPIEQRLLVRARGKWSYSGPRYDEDGDLVPETVQ